MSKQKDTKNELISNDLTLDQLSPPEREQCDQLEEWISGLQNDAKRDNETNGYLEKIALSLWEIGNQSADHNRESDSAKPDHDAANPQIKGYKICGVIGRGGMGVVYRAIDLQLKRNVALKVMPENKVGSDRAKKRFRIEVQAAAQLEHPAIVPVYEFGEYSGGLYYSMREIDGIDLSKKLLGGETNHELDRQQFGPILDPPSLKYQQWVAKSGKAVAEALTHSHDQLVVHRDVKPANILIDRKGNPYLSDFGLARINDGSDLTADDDLLGTLRYMSPEQISAGQESVDGRSDIYSLGITLYEMLTGHPAISETSFAAAWKQITEGRIAKPRHLNPRIDPDLETIVLKAIAPEPEQRYETAVEFALDLDRFLKVMPVHAKRATVGLKVNRWVKRNRNWVSALALVAGSLLAVIFNFAIYNAYRSSRDAETIRQRSSQLLDSAGVEKLFRQDSMRARTDFEQAAQLTSHKEDYLRQQLRLTAIDAWSPQLIEDKRREGYLLARHISGTELISVEDSSGSTCFVLNESATKTKLFETDRRIESAAISEDGNWYAIVICDRTNQNPELKIYDVTNQRLSSIVDGLDWRISDLWFLPNNRSLFTTGWGGNAKIWNVKQAKLVRSLDYGVVNDNRSWVFSARTNKNKTVMAAVLNPGRIVAYSLPDLKPIWKAPIEISTWRADAFAISPDGRWIAAGTAEDGIRIWEFETGKEFELRNNVAGNPTVACFSLEGQYLAVGDDRGGVYVWKMPNDSGDFAFRQGVVMWHDYSIGSLRFNEQLQLVVGAGDSVRVWRIADNQPLTPLLPIESRVTSVAWTARQNIRVRTREKSGSRHQVWEIPAHLKPRTLGTGSLLKIFAEATPDENDDQILIDVMARSSDAGQQLLKELQTSNSRPFDRSIVIPSNTIKFASSGDSKRIALLQPENNLSCLLSVFERDGIQQIGDSVVTKNYPAHVDLNEDGTKWITGGFDGKIIVGDVATGQVLHEYQLPNWSIDARFLSNGQFGSICWDGKLRIWNQSGEKIGEFDHASIPDQLVSRNNISIVANGDSISTYVYEGEADNWNRTKEVDHQSGTIEHMAISPSGDRWVSCSDNGTTIVWSIEGNEIAKLPVIGPVSICRFSKNGRWLATLSEAGTINLWEAKTGKPMGPAIQGRTRIEVVEWTRDRLSFGGNDKGSHWISEIELPKNWIE